MFLLNHLWSDESGAVLSAELLLVGTLGIVGATAGIAAVGHAVNGEMEEVAYSLRSLDQSYHLEGYRGCRAWTAGSSYTQRTVEESHAELERVMERHREEGAEHDDDGESDEDRVHRRRRHDQPRDEHHERRRDRDGDDDSDRWDGDEHRRHDADDRDDDRRRDRDDDGDDRRRSRRDRDDVDDDR